MKRFWESGEIKVYKGQGWKPLLDACDLQSLRRHCMKNCHASVINIATWPQEYLGKLLTLNTIQLCMKRRKFETVSRKKGNHLFRLFRNASEFFRLELAWDEWKESFSSFLWEKKTEVRLCYGACIWYEGAGMDDLPFCESLYENFGQVQATVKVVRIHDWLAYEESIVAMVEMLKTYSERTNTDLPFRNGTICIFSHQARRM